MSEDGAKPSTQALDAFAEWMRRVEQDAKFVDARLDSLERKALPSTIPAGMDDFERRISVLEERERTHDARIEGHYSRIEALEAKLPDNTLNPKHWRAEPDGTIDASVQLRRDVGTLVRAARNWKAYGSAGDSAFLANRERARAAYDDFCAALKLFEGDYT